MQSLAACSAGSSRPRTSHYGAGPAECLPRAISVLYCSDAMAAPRWRDGPGPDSSARRLERKELRPWSFIVALWAGDDGVVVIVHRHRYVRLPTLGTPASDGYDHIFGHIILQAQNTPERPSDNLSAGYKGIRRRIGRELADLEHRPLFLRLGVRCDLLAALSTKPF
jgi:hypothetical protein